MDIIKKLQIKFIVSVVLIMTIVFAAVVASIYFATINGNKRETDRLLEQLIKSDGRINKEVKLIQQSRKPFLDTEKSMKPLMKEDKNKQVERKEFDFQRIPPPKPDRSNRNPPFPPENLRNFFTVNLNQNGKINNVITEFPISFTMEEVEKLIESVYKQDKSRGVINGLQYLISKKNEGYLVVFVEIKSELNMQAKLYRISLIVYGISLLLSLFIAWVLSIWAVKPIRQVFSKQKRFISDAGHELKTPLSVITANLDVLEQNGLSKSKWFMYIRSEVERMNRLVQDLLYLAKNDDGEVRNSISTFNLSRAIENAVLPFEASIYEDKKYIDINITPDVIYVGDENRIKQVIIILLDNALIHTDAGDKIKVTLTVEGSKKIVSVYNTGEGVTEVDKEKIFERFYRVDSSRNRESGGSGLGLAIARSIVEAHHAKITVDSVPGEYIVFTMYL